MTYHILGPKGTFTELALERYTQNYQAVIYHDTIDETLRHVDQDSLGIVPIENTIEGYLMPTLDGLFSNALKIIDEVYLDIEFLCVFQEALRKDLILYVQFAAKNQCKEWIENMGFKEIIYTESNTQAYHYYLNHPKHSAAIIPIHMKHQEKSVKVDILNTYNQTRFVIVSKQHQEKEKDLFKVSMVLSPIKDYPGLLYDMLGHFKDAKINLTSIISRPKKQIMGTYHFYLTMEVSKMQYKDILKLEKEHSHHYHVTILGVY